jgi:hypothetical protein
MYLYIDFGCSLHTTGLHAGFWPTAAEIYNHEFHNYKVFKNCYTILSHIIYSSSPDSPSLCRHGLRQIGHFLFFFFSI